MILEGIMGYGVDFSKWTEWTEEDYEKIIMETTKIIEEGKDRKEVGIAYYNRGWVLYKKHQEEKAIPDFTEAIEIMPNFADVYFMRGASYYMFYEHEKALIDAQKALELNKTDVQFINFIEKLKREMEENEIPNETTIKAMEDNELFTYNSAEEMIADALGDPNWKNVNQNRKV
jgi:tetratricopeptide (TPR) repeat protein